MGSNQLCFSIDNIIGNPDTEINRPGALNANKIRKIKSVEAEGIFKKPYLPKRLRKKIGTEKSANTKFEIPSYYDFLCRTFFPSGKIIGEIKCIDNRKQNKEDGEGSTAPQITKSINKQLHATLPPKFDLSGTSVFEAIKYLSKVHTCCICARNYDHPFKLFNHQRSHFMSSKPILCDFCGTVFNTFISLQRHYSQHFSGPAYVCDECGISYNSSSNVKKHLEYHISS